MKGNFLGKVAAYCKQIVAAGSTKYRKQSEITENCRKQPKTANPQKNYYR